MTFSARCLLDDGFGALRAVTLRDIPADRIVIEVDEIGPTASFQGRMLIELEPEHGFTAESQRTQRTMLGCLNPADPFRRTKEERMNGTNVFATAEELEELRKQSDALDREMRSAADRLIKRCHELALQHGLPEIAGFYGLDHNGEFVTV